MSKLPDDKRLAKNAAARVKRNLPDETRRRLLEDKRERLKRRKMIQEEYVKLPFCKLTEQTL